MKFEMTFLQEGKLQGKAYFGRNEGGKNQNYTKWWAYCSKGEYIYRILWFLKSG